MGRKETTKMLGDLLVSRRLSGIGKYWASEVTVDYGSKEPKRVDFMEFIPENQLCISGIEKGIFICYEIKSCLADFRSGYGQNFFGEKNYLVMTMETWKKVQHEDIPHNVGVLVAVPVERATEKGAYEEYENPSPFEANTKEKGEEWDFYCVRPSHKTYRNRSMSELLFCMLRSAMKPRL